MTLGYSFPKMTTLGLYSFFSMLLNLISSSLSWPNLWQKGGNSVTSGTRHCNLFMKLEVPYYQPISLLSQIIITRPIRLSCYGQVFPYLVSTFSNCNHQSFDLLAGCLQVWDPSLGLLNIQTSLFCCIIIFKLLLTACQISTEVTHQQGDMLVQRLQDDLQPYNLVKIKTSDGKCLGVLPHTLPYYSNVASTVSNLRTFQHGTQNPEKSFLAPEDKATLADTITKYKKNLLISNVFDYRL